MIFPKKTYRCKTCPRKCGAERGLRKGKGYCGMGFAPKVARAALHRWEEPCLTGTGGCGAVFFSGCVLRCVYCQNAPISHEGHGRSVSVEDLREMYRSLREQGAETLDLVSGTQFLPAIAASLEEPPGLPVIWNSGGYDSVEALKLLEGKVQIYLPDLKYVDSGLSQRLSGAADYFAVASRAIEEMVRQVGPCRFSGDGRLEQGVLVRHLVLPGLLENTFDVLDYFAEKLKDRGVWLSLMAQYTPQHRPGEPEELSRPLTAQEYHRATEYALTLGIDRGFFQDPTAADEAYIPAFDLTGVEPQL